MKKNISFIFILVISNLSPQIVSAKMYKGYDAEGNVIYSDAPFEDAEKYSPPPISVVETPQDKAKKQAATEAKALADKKQADFKYKSFDIVTPASSQTIWNEPDLSVSVRLKPALNVAAGHTIWLLLDGKTKIKNSQSTSFSVGRLERGAHEVQALIKDEGGKTVVRTRTNLFFIKQGSQ